MDSLGYMDSKFNRILMFSFSLLKWLVIIYVWLGWAAGVQTLHCLQPQKSRPQKLISSRARDLSSPPAHKLTRGSQSPFPLSFISVQNQAHRELMIWAHSELTSSQTTFPHFYNVLELSLSRAQNSSSPPACKNTTISLSSSFDIGPEFWLASKFQLQGPYQKEY